MEVIGVAGQMRAGKDTVADYLHSILNDRRSEEHWLRTAFAKNVKKVFMDVFDKDIAYIEEWKTKQDPPPDLDATVRKALQFIGDGFRQINSSIWVELMFRGETTPKIISDVRYINELSYIKSNGGYTLLVARPDRINNDLNGSEAEIRPFIEHAVKISHLTGKRCFLAKDYPISRGRWFWPFATLAPEGWEYVDCVIVNDGTIDDLYACINEFIVPEIETFFKEAA